MQTKAAFSNDPRNQSLYEPALDGLRFMAFLSVFLHHLPEFRASPILMGFREYGWIGVELFFVISSLLFFRLLNAEYEKNGSISAARFYIRRLLRIYPLMILFAIAMMFYWDRITPSAWLRLGGIATFSDNFITWVDGYNTAIPTTAHLWTLAFEFQVYLFIPYAFMAWKRLGNARFLILLAAIYIACLALRLTMTYFGARHPIVWVTPFLQPEAILIGIALATGCLKWIPAAAWPVIFALAAWKFVNTPVPWAGMYSAALSYPLAAIACVSLVEGVRRLSVLRRAFSMRPVVFLGTISFGLYVFHLFGIHLGAVGLASINWAADFQASPISYMLYSVSSLVITILIAALSYYVLEMPFLRLKDRFATVLGREINSPSTHGVGAGSRATKSSVA